MWTRLADWIVASRRLALIFVVLVLAALASLPLLQFEFSPQTLFDTTSERARIFQEYRAKYGADDHILMLLVVADTDKAATWAVLDDIERRVRSEVAEVERISSLASVTVPRSDGPGLVTVGRLAESLPSTDAEAARLAGRARDHPLLVNTLISADGDAACVLLKVADDIDSQDEVRPVVKQLRAIGAEAAAALPGAEAHLLGPHAYRVTVVGVMVREELRFAPLTALMLALVLWLLFRSVIGVMIPLLSVGLGALWTVALMAITGEAINIINTITATLILVIGVADAIHMMTRYAQERSVGAGREESMRRTLATVGAACLLTSLTTAVGFATLLTAHLSILRHFGIYAALGVMLTFGMTIVFVPWALLRSPRDPIVAAPGLQLDNPGWLGGLLAAQGRFVRRRPRTVAVVAVVITLGFAAGIPRTTIDNFIMEYVPRDEPILEAHQLLEEKLAGVVFLDVLLEAGGDIDQPWLEPEMLRAAAEAEAKVLADPGVRATISVLGLLRELQWVQRGGEASGASRSALPETRRQAAELLVLAEMSGEETVVATHLDADRRVLRITLRASDLGARAYLELEEDMKGWLADAFADSPVPVTANITGTSQVGYGGIDSLIRDLLRSLSWAFVLIFLTLVVLFRSWKLAGLAMLPNALPVIVVLGGMGWLGMHLETLSAMVFSIGLGIAVDDTIHYLARYCEEVRAGCTPEEAVQRTTERTGRAILYTSVLLLVGFGVLRTSAFPPNQSFAVLASSVIGAALLADLYLLPALLLWFRPHVPGAPSNRSSAPAQG